jgi:iron complex transport system ATP-binding protein
MYCNRLCLLHLGEIIAIGAPAEVLTPASIEQVYGVRAEVQLDPRTQRPHIRYVERDDRS